MKYKERKLLNMALTDNPRWRVGIYLNQKKVMLCAVHKLDRNGRTSEGTVFSHYRTFCSAVLCPAQQ